MSGRYEIFDILAQNSDGVVFHAEDRQTKRQVVLRRFFPFGADGGGLEGEERDAYEVAVRRLVRVANPALRTVLAGGSDPVDGMPFLVTEWVAGASLSLRLEEKSLSPSSALALADLAIETSIALSETFGEEAIWIDTDPESIILGESGSERPVTFWISPLRWLGSAESRDGLRPLLEMIEEVTGWNGRVISDSSGHGLGAWINAIRDNPDVWSLAQARYALHHGVTAVPSATATRQLRKGAAAQAAPPKQQAPVQTIPAPPREAPSFKQSANWWPWAIAGLLVILAGGFVTWQRLRPSGEKQADSALATTDASSSGVAPPSAAQVDAATLASQRAAAFAEEIEKTAVIPEDRTSGLITPEQNAKLIEVGKQLREKTGQTVSLSFRIHLIRASKSGKTLYVEFGDSADPDAVCARHRTTDSDLTQEQLQTYVGKLVRIRGKIVKDPSGRIAIDLASEDDLETLDE